MQIGPRQYDLRFWSAGEEGFDIEAVLMVSVVPAAPAAWQIWPIEGEGSSIEVQEEDQAWQAPCGQPFTVALDLVDSFGNKYDLPACMHHLKLATRWWSSATRKWAGAVNGMHSQAVTCGCVAASWSRCPVRLSKGVATLSSGLLPTKLIA